MIVGGSSDPHGRDITDGRHRVGQAYLGEGGRVAAIAGFLDNNLLVAADQRGEPGGAAGRGSLTQACGTLAGDAPGATWGMRAAGVRSRGEKGKICA